MPEGAAVLEDPPGDIFSLRGGPVGTSTPFIDVLTMVGYISDLDAEQAAALSEALACGTGQTAGGIAGAAPYHVSCNQDLPFEPGPHAILVTTWDAPIPDPWPADTQCSWSFQADIDTDPTTGIPNPPPGHPLTAADIYHEVLMFYSSSSGDFQNYNLATDYREPPRSDTGQYQGNIGTLARFAMGNGLPGDSARSLAAAVSAQVAGLEEDDSWVLAVIPLVAFAVLASAHGHCGADAVDFFDDGELALYTLIELLIPPED